VVAVIGGDFGEQFLDVENCAHPSAP
jgi:hypothetical protein